MTGMAELLLLVMKMSDLQRTFGCLLSMEESEPLLAAAAQPRRVIGHAAWSGPFPESTVVEDFRRRLKYYFMNPCQKYRARGRKPWKLMLQILKIAIITVQVGCGFMGDVFAFSKCLLYALFSVLFCFPKQLVSFGLSNEMMVTFKEENLMTFRHLFLKGYKDNWQGSHAIYSQADLYDHIYYLISRVVEIQNKLRELVVLLKC